MTARNIKLTIEARDKAHACQIIEHIINPALKDYGCVVQWPDLAEPEIAVVYDADELNAEFEPRISQ